MEGRPFRRRDDVGGGAGARRFRDLDAALGAERLRDLAHRREGVAVAVAKEMTACDGDPQALDAAVERRQRRLGRTPRRDRIVGIGALHRVIGEREVGDAARQRPEMVEARDEGKAAGPRQPPEGRFQAEHAAERGRDPDRAVGVGAERERHEARRDRRARAAGGAAGHAIERMRVARGSVMDVLAREVVGVLAHVEGADKHRAGSFEAAHERAVALGRRAFAIDLGAGPGRKAGYVDEVLDRERNAGERARRSAGRDAAVDRVGARERALPGDVGERVRAAVDRGDACKRRLGDLPRACAPGRDLAGDLGGRSLRVIHA